MKLVRNHKIWLLRKQDENKTEEAQMENILKCFEIILRLMGIRCHDGLSCCESIGLDKPPKLNFTKKELLEAEFDRESFISKHLADDPDDEQQSASTRNQSYYDTKYKTLNSEQKKFVDDVMAAAKRQYDFPANNDEQRKFFLTGDGGTGKSHAIKVTYSLNDNIRHC